MMALIVQKPWADSTTLGPFCFDRCGGVWLNGDTRRKLASCLPASFHPSEEMPMAASRLALAFAAAALSVPAAALAEPPKVDGSKLPPAANRKVDFVADIQPLFKKNCQSCHGAEAQESGLRLDQKRRALDGGDHGQAIVPGKSADSRLVHLIAGIDEEIGLMPPEGMGTPLAPAEIGL